MFVIQCTKRLLEELKIDIKKGIRENLLAGFFSLTCRIKVRSL